ncbi:MAG TPA: hypothetical protein VLM37_10895, partial [Fibrobacteraceae bacterium]|nr:hypothetical protein [Fibrobacteraceae bacterium]
MNRTLSLLASIILVVPALALAQTDSSLEDRQQSLLQRLTDIENETPGLSINGDVFYRGQTSE